MKIKLKNAFGIKNEISLGEDNKSVIIFGPNGVGKSSISKTFEEIKEGFSEGFGQEKQGTKDSLLYDNDNIEKLIADNKTALVLNNKKLDDAISVGPIRDYMSRIGATNNMKEFCSKINSALDNILTTYSDDFEDPLEPLEPWNTFEEKNFNEVNMHRLVNSVNEFMTNEYEKEELAITKKALEKLYQDKKTLEKFNSIKRKSFSYKNEPLKGFINIIEKAVKEGTKGYPDDWKFVIDIMERIVERDKTRKNEEKPQMGKLFGYRNSETEVFKPVNKVYNEIISKIEEIGFSEEDSKTIYDMIGVIETYNIKKSLGTLKNFSKASKINKELQSQIIKKQKKYLYNIILKTIEFENINETFINISSEFKNSYNKLVKKANSFIDNLDNLSWTIKVNEISAATEGFSCKIINRNGYQSNSEPDENGFEEYASSGQKRIVSLALNLLNSSEYDMIIIDDVISSLDFDHSAIFLNMLNEIKQDFILLTHNFSLITNISYNNDLNCKCSLYILDSFPQDNAINYSYVFPIKEWKEVEKISILMKKQTRPKLRISKRSMLSGTLHEYITNYIKPEGKIKCKKEKSCLAGNCKCGWLEQSELREIKRIINKYARHWSQTDTSITSFVAELKGNIKVCEHVLFGTHSIFNELLESQPLQGNANDAFVSYFEQSIDFLSIIKSDVLSLIDWISMKYFIAMKIRQLIEAKRKKGIGISPSGWITLNSINKNLNFLNHLDNLKWTPIFEFPSFKLLMYLKKVEGIV